MKTQTEAKDLADAIKAKSEKARNIAIDYQHFADKRLAGCKAALAFTRRVDWKIRLEVINELLGLYGTEAIRGDWQNGYWCDIVAVYCNAGDTYDLTVIHVRGDGRNPAGKFIVSSWGDWVESNQDKYQIQ